MSEVLSTDAPGFLLGEATAAERIARDRLTYESWGGGLTREQYLDRERILRQTDHGRLSMRTWVLRVPNGVIMASCETFRLPLLPGGAVEVIATVYVDKPLRGARMASRMLQALVTHRREAGLDGLILFSEVGAKVYEPLRFSVLPGPARSWKAQLPSGETNFDLLGLKDISEAIEWRNRARGEGIDLRLSEHLFDWHHARSRFYAGALPRPISAVIGARADGVQALWVPSFKNNVLQVLDATGPAGASLDGVMVIAAAEAEAMGLSSVQLWDDAVSERLIGGEVSSRGDDLPMGQAFTPRGALLLGPLSRATWA